MALQIQKNGETVTLRNLQEQVQKNKEDIAAHYAIDRALSNLGIKIVGQVNLPGDLPDPLTYPGEYGDTYAVGFKSEVAAGLASYNYYVFTRPDLNAGITENQWLNVGKISIEGPIGPAGPQGIEGKKGISSKWYSGSSIPSSSSELVDGDMYLQSNGDVYRYSSISNLWKQTGNIRGPQGAQGNRGLQGNIGPKGDKGDRGPKGDPAALINIYGVLANTNQLPTPSLLNNLNAAFLIGSTAPYSLYMQVGENPSVAVWQNVGVLNGVSAVTTDGVLQSIWDTNTKVNKYIARVPSIYTEDPKTGSGLIPFSRDAVDNTVAVRDDDAGLNVETVPSNNKSAVNVGYLNNILSEYTPGSGGGSSKLYKHTYGILLMPYNNNNGVMFTYEILTTNPSELSYNDFINHIKSLGGFTKYSSHSTSLNYFGNAFDNRGNKITVIQNLIIDASYYGEQTLKITLTTLNIKTNEVTEEVICDTSIGTNATLENYIDSDGFHIDSIEEIKDNFNFL